MVSERGLSALNMRSVAQACHLAVGSLYHYFPNKDDLVIATVARVWQDIFHMDQTCHANLPFPEYVQWIFDSVQQGAKKYPHFLTAHSLSFASTGKGKAKDAMEQYFTHIRLGMTEALHADPAIPEGVFHAGYPEAEFVEFVLTNLLALLMQQKSRCDVLLETIRRAIYLP